MASIANLADKKDSCAKVQETIRKSIERAFGGLQKKWHFFVHASCFMCVDKMDKIVQGLVISHNMCWTSEWEKKSR